MNRLGSSDLSASLNAILDKELINVNETSVIYELPVREIWSGIFDFKNSCGIIYLLKRSNLNFIVCYTPNKNFEIQNSVVKDKLFWDISSLKFSSVQLEKENVELPTIILPITNSMDIQVTPWDDIGIDSSHEIWMQTLYNQFQVAYKNCLLLRSSSLSLNAVARDIVASDLLAPAKLKKVVKLSEYSSFSLLNDYLQVFQDHVREMNVGESSHLNSRDSPQSPIRSIPLPFSNVKRGRNDLLIKEPVRTTLSKNDNFAVCFYCSRDVRDNLNVTADSDAPDVFFLMHPYVSRKSNGDYLFMCCFRFEIPEMSTGFLGDFESTSESLSKHSCYYNWRKFRHYELYISESTAVVDNLGNLAPRNSSQNEIMCGVCSVVPRDGVLGCSNCVRSYCHSCLNRLLGVDELNKLYDSKIGCGTSGLMNVETTKSWHCPCCLWEKKSGGNEVAAHSVIPSGSTSNALAMVRSPVGRPATKAVISVEKVDRPKKSVINQKFIVKSAKPLTIPMLEPTHTSSPSVFENLPPVTTQYEDVYYFSQYVYLVLRASRYSGVIEEIKHSSEVEPLATEDYCFLCKDGGDLVECDFKYSGICSDNCSPNTKKRGHQRNCACRKVYHEYCLNYTILDGAIWNCPRHFCSVCGFRLGFSSTNPKKTGKLTFSPSKSPKKAQDDDDDDCNIVFATNDASHNIPLRYYMCQFCPTSFCGVNECVQKYSNTFGSFSFTYDMTVPTDQNTYIPIICANCTRMGNKCVVKGELPAKILEKLRVSPKFEGKIENVEIVVV